jgi:hypothetical protein
VTEEDDRTGDDRMDKMLDAIWPELETNPDDPPTPEVQKFFDILRASEEPLHEHTIVSKNEMKCLKYCKSRFIGVVNEDGEKVMMKVAHKKLRYMPLMSQMK